MDKQSILFITNSSNWPLTDGKRQRTWFLIEALSKKYTIDLLLMGYEKEIAQIKKSNNSIRELYFIPLNDFSILEPGYSFLLSDKQKEVKKLFFNQVKDFFDNAYIKNHYNFIFSRYLEPIIAIPLDLNIKIVCDIDDVYFEKYQTRIKNESSLIRKLKLKLLFFLGSKKVKKILTRIDIPIIVKKSDVSFPKLANALCLPNLPFGFYIENKIISDTDFTPTSSQYINYGFIGKISYRPNYEGLVSFINSVWNPLLEKGIDAKFVIAGSGLMPEILKKAISNSKNIEVLGFIESTSFFWNQINVLIVPVFEGGGSNIKIAEAFMYGKSVIAHPFASRGYEDFLNSDFLFLPKNTKDWIAVMASFTILKVPKSELISNKAKQLFDLDLWNQKLLNALK